jgi:polysaccharide export outer membrane protein
MRSNARVTHAARGLAAAIGLALPSFLGCADMSGPRGEVPPAELGVPGTAEYRVGPADQLSVRVLPDPAIERSVKVRPDGRFSMDLIGDVEASGRTLGEIAQDIETRIATYRQSPSVSVALDAPSSTAVTVLGEVGGPTVFPLDRPLRLSEAIARAGGPTELAATSRIRVMRRGEESVTRYDANLDLIQRGDPATDLVIEEGDLIYVPAATPVVAGYKIRRAMFPFEAAMRSLVGPILGLVFRFSN